MSTEQILSELVDAGRRLRVLEAERDDAIRERDAAIVRARKTGTTASDIADLLDVDRQVVYRILKRANLRP